MKWCKRLLFLLCCLCFLAHSGNENLYQTHLYLDSANMNHQTIYSGKCHYHGSRVRESSSQKQGHQTLGKLVTMAGLLPIFLATTSRSSIIPMHQSRSNITETSTSRFSSNSTTRATCAIFLTLFNMEEGMMAPKNVFDHCAQMLRGRKLKLGSF